jgi:hypothetical protein
MKTVKFTQSFKTVSEALAAKMPALADKVGKKRESLEVSFLGFENAYDLENVPVEQICFFLNQAIENYGKSLVQEHAVNWDFVPAVEDLTLANAFAEATRVTTRARTLTKETAAAFAKFYVMFAPSLLEMPSKAAEAGAQVLREFLTYSKQESFCRNISARLESLAEKILEQEEESQVMQYLAESGIDLLEVMNALIEKFDPANLTVITADAL